MITFATSPVAGCLGPIIDLGSVRAKLTTALDTICLQDRHLQFPKVSWEWSENRDPQIRKVLSLKSDKPGEFIEPAKHVASGASPLLWGVPEITRPLLERYRQPYTPNAEELKRQEEYDALKTVHEKGDLCLSRVPTGWYLDVSGRAYLHTDGRAVHFFEFRGNEGFILGYGLLASVMYYVDFVYREPQPRGVALFSRQETPNGVLHQSLYSDSSPNESPLRPRGELWSKIRGAFAPKTKS